MAVATKRFYSKNPVLHHCLSSGVVLRFVGGECEVSGEESIAELSEAIAAGSPLLSSTPVAIWKVGTQRAGVIVVGTASTSSGSANAPSILPGMLETAKGLPEPPKVLGAEAALAALNAANHPK